MGKKQNNDLKDKANNELQSEDMKCELQNEDVECELEKIKEDIKTKYDKIKEYESLVEEHKDRYLRLQADFDNYRKRIAKEREDIFSNALEDIMVQLLPIIDNFERALEFFKTGDLDKKYIEGLEIMYKDFISTLSKNGLTEIEALKCDFDPNLHHAVMQVEAGEEDDNQIKDVFQKGYMLKTKVIRPSMVQVAVKS